MSVSVSALVVALALPCTASADVPADSPAVPAVPAIPAVPADSTSDSPEIVVPAATPRTIRFGAGSKKGGFTRLANVLAGGLEETGDRVRLDIRHTSGSCDNIKQLLRGELDVALVQYDVAAEAFKASLSEPDTEDGGEAAFGGWMCQITADMAHGAELQLISALTEGAVQMLVRRPVRIDEFAQLGDAPIYLGKDGSGSFETAKVIVGAAGHTVKSLNLLQGGSGDAYAALRNQELLMMLRTTERGDDDIADVVASGLASINPLPEDVLNRLIDGYPYYKICQVEPETYQGLEYAVPTVCVSTVLLTVKLPDEGGAGAEPLSDASIDAILDAVERVAKSSELTIEPRATGFAEKEPIPLHTVAFERERSKKWRTYGKGGLLLIILLAGGTFLRRFLRRRGYLRDPLSAGLEGHLSNPFVPFAGFALIVMAATGVVWLLEHDSNARLRTLDDSFWEMNTFATGNFSTETLKTPGARFVGAVATIMGLGALAWFTAALTNIFARDQTRIFQRRRDHLVILNFREDMLELIRLLRSPGPSQHRAIHVLVPEALPARVRLQLAKVKALTIHQENPEIPSNLIGLRLHRAARVIVLEGEPTASGEVFHPLRIARAVHQATLSTGQGDPRALSPSAGRPALAGDHLRGPAPRTLPRTLVETSEDDPEALFAPFRGWLHAINARQLTYTWLVHAASESLFADFFTGVVSFRDDNAEVYTAVPPPWLIGRPWIVARRTLYSLEGRGGVLPIGLYRSAEGGPDGADSGERLMINPEFEILIQASDLILALCEDAADFTRVLRRSRKAASEQELRWERERGRAIDDGAA